MMKIVEKSSIAENAPIWEGIYTAFAQVPRGEADVFDRTHWTERLKGEISKGRSRIDKSGLPLSDGAYRVILPALAAALRREQDFVHVLDFGGGGGGEYIDLRCALGPDVTLQYTVLEVPAVCGTCGPEFSDDSAVEFISTLPEKGKKFDIIHAGGALQYVEDWQDLLKNFLNYKPHYMVLTDLPAGSIPTFVSGQHYYGSLIPRWFWNLSEFESALDQLGYRIVMKTRHERIAQNRRGISAMDNFPTEYRLEQNYDLVCVAHAISP